MPSPALGGRVTDASAQTWTGKERFLPFGSLIPMSEALSGTPVAMSLATFCNLYAISKSRVYELLADGTLKARKYGAKTLIDRESAANWYNSLPAYSPDRPPGRISKMRKTMDAAYQAAIAADGGAK